MKYEKFDKTFEDFNKVFQEMDKVVKLMEKKMEETFVAAEAMKPEPWEKWFAWHPVKVNNKRQWMKTVYRRSHWQYGKGLNRVWEYTDMFGVLKEAGSGSNSR